MEFVNKKYKFVDYIKIPFNISPIFTILIVFLDFVIALIPSMQVMATASFIDTAVNIFLNDAKLNIYIPIFLIVALILISWTSSIIMKFAKLKLKLYVDENIKLSMVEKRNNLKYKHVENEVTWDLIRRIGEEPSEQIVKGFENIINLIQYIIRIISLLLIIMSQIWWVAIIVLIIAYALFKLSSYAGKVDYDAFVESEKHLRKADYLKEILSSRDAINERTLFGYSENIGKRWLDKFKVAKTIEMKAMKNNFIKLKTASSITAILSMLIALILLEPLKSKVITAGMYIGLVSAAFNLVQQMSWDFSYEM